MGFLILRSESGIDFFTPLFKFNLIMSAGFSFCLVGRNRSARNEFRAHDPSSCIFICNDVTISINDFNIFYFEIGASGPRKKIGHLVFFSDSHHSHGGAAMQSRSRGGGHRREVGARPHQTSVLFCVYRFAKKGAKTRMANAKIKR